MIHACISNGVIYKVLIQSIDTYFKKTFLENFERSKIKTTHRMDNPSILTNQGIQFSISFIFFVVQNNRLCEMAFILNQEKSN